MTLITFTLEGQNMQVPEGVTVAAALSLSGVGYCRLSVSHQPRAPFCGMGVCQECRVTINGMRRLACQTLCESEMCVERIREQ
ncbi:(2Fe-2S)-binding protein [Yersinia wautersii]|uniref:Uncharacterized anaerobic dehydrogenase n=1 Tax=Yersinia wautersii TaxID=1341643 RepID=A0ABP1Z7E3_9GAMM|nr:(2Fe-2S)-binding protein [Yersinia wautersii]CRG48570.1 Uncharacterized anaerobic dehydrogenase [Yersinia wautersii]